MHFLLIGATGRTGSAVLSESLARGHSITALVRDPSSETITSLLATHPAYKDKLTLVTGSPLNQADVTQAVQSAAAAATSTLTTTTTTTTTTNNNNNNPSLTVITTLNARRTSDNPFASPHPSDSPPRMMADCTANLIKALSHINQSHNPNPNLNPKIVALSALGAGSSAPHTHWLIRAMTAHTNMKHQYADHAAVEDELHAAAAAATTPIDFVLVRPTRLQDSLDSDGAPQRAKVFDTTATTANDDCSCGRPAIVGMMAAVSRLAVARFLVDAAESDRYNGQDPILV